MKGWRLIIAIVLPIATVLIGLLLLWTWKWRSRNAGADADAMTPAGITSVKLRQSFNFHHLHSRSFRKPHRAASRQQPPADFNWVDHPTLASDAAEGGWSRFAFSSHASPPPRPRGAPWVEASWGGHPGSSDFMQVVRIVCPREKAASGGSQACFCCVSMDLPVPGPLLKGSKSFFPQESYFEITILYLQPQIDIGGGETEGVVTLGLTRGGFSPDKVPGSHSGSVAFNSNGAVYLEGKQLVSSSEGSHWGAVTRVVGCGFDPSRKKVIFTIDSKLLHVIHCSSDAFKNPLYPSLAADTVDVMVTVNLGQKPFKYAAANSQRTSNPSCKPSMVMMADAADDNFDSSVSIGYYNDSVELFSVGRTDLHCWLNNTGSTGARKNDDVYSRKIGSFDVDSESDLFEISLDN